MGHTHGTRTSNGPLSLTADVSLCVDADVCARPFQDVHQSLSESAAIRFADARAALLRAATSFFESPGTDRMRAPPPPPPPRAFFLEMTAVPLLPPLPLLPDEAGLRCV
eukprot:2959133-Prymnesium_polylepis.1